MLENVYRKFVNAIAFKNIVKNAPTPKINLGVGEAENLASIPVLLFRDVKPKNKKPVKEKANNVAYEDTQPNFHSEQLTEKDFDTKSFDLGMPTVRW